MNDLLAGLGRFFAELLKMIMRESKKPTTVEPAGYDEELVEDFDSQFAADIDDDEYEFLSNDAHKESKDQPNG